MSGRDDGGVKRRRRRRDPNVLTTERERAYRRLADTSTIGGADPASSTLAHVMPPRQRAMSFLAGLAAASDRSDLANTYIMNLIGSIVDAAS